MTELSRIKAGIRRELPGWVAQKLMTPLDTEAYRQPKPNSKQAAVVALLYPDASSELQLVFIKRASFHPDDKHGGQISFPGGQKEPQDEGMQATALRELEEELGIPASQVEVLGALSPIYIYVSDFQVYPFICYMDHTPDFEIQVSEVAYPIAIPLRALAEQPFLTTDIHIRGMVIKDAPYYDLSGEVLWGATAMMTSELLQVARG